VERIAEPLLVTRRLILKPLLAEDADDVFCMRADAEVMAFWDGPPDDNPGVTAAVIEQFLEDVGSGDACYLTVRLRNGVFAGLCDLSELRAGVSADIGFMFARRLWGTGLAFEAVTSVLAHALTLRLKSVRARIHRNNMRSARLLERAGFKVIEDLACYEIRPGVFRDCQRLELLLAEG
jgi:ribosomal-protein-alanine N-acetyltransferase